MIQLSRAEREMINSRRHEGIHAVEAHVSLNAREGGFRGVEAQSNANNSMKAPRDQHNNNNGRSTVILNSRLVLARCQPLRYRRLDSALTTLHSAGEGWGWNGLARLGCGHTVDNGVCRRGSRTGSPEQRVGLRRARASLSASGAASRKVVCGHISECRKAMDVTRGASSRCLRAAAHAHGYVRRNRVDSGAHSQRKDPSECCGVAILLIANCV